MDIKLKHIDYIKGDGTVDVEGMFYAIYGKKKTLIGNRWVQLRRIKRFAEQLNKIMNTDLLELKIKEGTKIRIPKNIDSIPFRAMTELMTYIEKDDRSVLSDYISNVVCMGVLSANVQTGYSSGGLRYISMRSRIQNLELFEAFGIFNWVTRQVNESSKKWNERFDSVEIKDPNYEAAKGKRMQQFNILNTLKSLCTDFNVTIDQAWQIQYGVVMSNNYSKATRSHIQEGIRTIKEQEFKKKRKKNYK